MSNTDIVGTATRQTAMQSTAQNAIISKRWTADLYCYDRFGLLWFELVQALLTLVGVVLAGANLVVPLLTENFKSMSAQQYVSRWLENRAKIRLNIFLSVQRGR